MACVWLEKASLLLAVRSPKLAGYRPSASSLAHLCSVQVLNPSFCSDHWLLSLSPKHSQISFYFVALLPFSSQNSNLFSCIYSPRWIRSKYHVSYSIWLRFMVYIQIYNKSSAQRSKIKQNFLGVKTYSQSNLRDYAKLYITIECLPLSCLSPKLVQECACRKFCIGDLTSTWLMKRSKL